VNGVPQCSKRIVFTLKVLPYHAKKGFLHFEHKRLGLLACMIRAKSKKRVPAFHQETREPYQRIFFWHTGDWKRCTENRLTVYHAPVYHAHLSCYIAKRNLTEVSVISLFQNCSTRWWKRIYRPVLVCKPDAPDAGKQSTNLNFGLKVAEMVHPFNRNIILNIRLLYNVQFLVPVT